MNESITQVLNILTNAANEADQIIKANFVDFRIRPTLKDAQVDYESHTADVLQTLVAIIKVLNADVNQFDGINWPSVGSMSALDTYLEEVLSFIDTSPEDEDYDFENCPGCGCAPGDGYTDDCDDEMGCGFYKQVLAETDLD